MPHCWLCWLVEEAPCITCFTLFGSQAGCCFTKRITARGSRLQNWGSADPAASAAARWYRRQDPVDPISPGGDSGVSIAHHLGQVASLFLARSVERGHETAIFAAPGASRRWLLGQSLAESVMLSLIGGALGLITQRPIIRATRSPNHQMNKSTKP
jgi:hypothetical protein